MQGLDISGHNEGINLEVVPCDFVICKATQGGSFISSDFTRQIKQAIEQGKAVGTYHYINGISAKDEMSFYVKTIKPYINKSIPVLDWEEIQNKAWQDEGYLEKCIKEFIKLTGKAPVIYASLSCFPWELCKKYGCGTWVAQYANYKQTGYQDTPWNEGAYTCDIRQYSETGRLTGYSGNLDLDKSYMTKEQWLKKAGTGVEVKPSTSTDTLNNSTSDLAMMTMQNKFGSGDDRKKALGSRYTAVQNFINHIYNASTKELAKETLQGTYGNGDKRKILLDTRYKEVQEFINHISGSSASTLAKETKNGKYGNGEERKILLGDRYKAVMKIINGK